MLDLLSDILPNIMVVIKLPDIMSGSVKFENILSIRVLGLLVILVCCKIMGKNELEARESKNFFLIRF